MTTSSLRCRRLRGLLIGLSATAALVGCASIPKDALVPTPDSLERRQLQSRRLDGISETNLLAASAGVLQDLGFNIDESETRLGVIVASKDRSAWNAGQITAAVALALFGAYYPVDKTQKIRVSLVTRPALAADGTPRVDSQILSSLGAVAVISFKNFQNITTLKVLARLSKRFDWSQRFWKHV